MEAPAATLGRRRAGPGRIVALLAAATLLGVGAGVALHFVLVRPAAPPVIVTEHYGLYGQQSWPAGARPAPAIDTLVDQTGHRFSLATLHGRSVALAFFDSHCNQECPLEGRELSAAEASLPAAERPALVAVSVNPLDTPASARKAAREWGLAGAAPWHWLMGTHAELAAVWKAYNIYVGRSADGDIPHTEALILIDGRGYERSGYLYPFAQRFVTHDLTVLGRQAKSRSHA
jgi:cytochrome oxidase Cu insertion factor (SCO1/SenC/PrrC family)